jgi:hypothetical protein
MTTLSVNQWRISFADVISILKIIYNFIMITVTEACKGKSKSINIQFIFLQNYVGQSTNIPLLMPKEAIL